MAKNSSSDRTGYEQNFTKKWRLFVVSLRLNRGQQPQKPQMSPEKFARHRLEARRPVLLVQDEAWVMVGDFPCLFAASTTDCTENGSRFSIPASDGKEAPHHRRRRPPHTAVAPLRSGHRTRKSSPMRHHCNMMARYPMPLKNGDFENGILPVGTQRFQKIPHLLTG